MEEEKEIVFNEEEFLCFLLIYASHIDYDFSQMEKEFILSKFDREVFDRMEQLFTSLGDYACLQLILDHRIHFFHTQEQIDSLFNLLQLLFASDGDYSRIEKNFLPFFLKMIDLKSHESGTSK